MNEEYFNNLFDWQFYINNHDDLKKNGVNNPTMAWNHLNKYGWKENRIPFEDPKVFEQFKVFKSGQSEKVFESVNLEEFIKKNNIKQLYVSDSLSHLKSRFLKKYGLKEYNNSNDEPTIFFGLYLENDFTTILNHKDNNRYIMLGGSDLPNIDKIKHLKDLKYISISNDISRRLQNINISPTTVELNLVDIDLFKPIAFEMKERNKNTKIFVYNGLYKKSDNDIIYNQKLIDEVVKRLPEQEFIYSNDLNLPYEKMPEIYAQCFIGLRLTDHDGNANMVQELEAMNIPVVHNHSDYGLKWKTVDDVVGYIENVDIKLLEIKNKNILINASSNLNVTAGDTVMISNYMNLLMKNNNKITLLSRYPVSQTFTRNLESNNYTIIIKENNREIVEELDIQSKTNDIIFIRNHEILDNLIDKPYLSKTILYGLDVHMDSITKMNNQFLSIITQIDKLKQLYIENNIPENKIHIVEPFSYKYDFDIEERNDEEIRLIYCGTLRDEENILEIIEEFEKIYLERPEVVLKIVYGKIHGTQEFTEKVNRYIKNGVKGITFKHNLSHRDACYEIATSDIGICWRKNGWGDNGEISTKVKEYEMYEVKLLTNNFNSSVDTNVLYFKESFMKILLDYDNKILISGNNTIIYMANTSLPKISGYTIRTKHILNEINKYNKIICFVKPNQKNKYSNIYFIDGIIYYCYNNLENYQKFITEYINQNKNIKFIWSASDNYNGIISGNISKACNIKSIYELRGLWHYTRKYKEQSENKFDSKFFNNYDNKEKLACSLNDFVLCENENILKICLDNYGINVNKLHILSNGVTPFKKKTVNLNNKSKIVFGYIGSIVSYEGLINLIKVFKQIDYKQYNTELLLIGGGDTIDAINTIALINSETQNETNIKYLGMIPHEEIYKYYDKIDIICLPRIDCEVCNIVAPLKPYEAMLNGKIVFASSVNAISEIITHNYNGILFDKTDINDLKNKMIDILNNEYNLDKIIQNGYEYCENHTWEITCKNILKIINSDI